MAVNERLHVADEGRPVFILQMEDVPFPLDTYGERFVFPVDIRKLIDPSKVELTCTAQGFVWSWFRF